MCVFPAEITGRDCANLTHPLGASPGLHQLQKPEGRPDGRAGRRGEPEDREGSAKASPTRKYPALFCGQSVSELVVWEKMLPDH